MRLLHADGRGAGIGGCARKSRRATTGRDCGRINKNPLMQRGVGRARAGGVVDRWVSWKGRGVGDSEMWRTRVGKRDGSSPYSTHER